MGLDTKTYWLTDRQSQCDFDLTWQQTDTSPKFIDHSVNLKIELGLYTEPLPSNDRENTRTDTQQTDESDLWTVSLR
jgi:hypothetical protein